MSYSEIVNLIFTIIFALYALFLAHFLFFAIVGIFKRKKFPHTNQINRYAIIIPARNEELVIKDLIESIRKNNYPQDKISIFVIAHNCTDNTINIAKSCGARTYIYNDSSKARKGYALKRAFELINQDYGIDAFDGYFIFDADNIIKDDFISKMNDAFEYYHRDAIINSYRSVKNYGSNLIADSYALMFGFATFTYSRGRTIFNCSSRVFGMGYLIPNKFLHDGWNCLTLTEDAEFSIEQTVKGRKIMLCDEATLFDEQPTNLHIMWRQRLRWEHGYLQSFKKKAKPLVKTIFSRKTKNRGSAYDLFWITLPYCLVLFFLTLLQIILLLFSPLMGQSLNEVFLNWNYQYTGFIGFVYNFFISVETGFLFMLLRSFTMLYVGFILMGIALLILTHNRHSHSNIFHKILLLLFWPLFMMLQLPADVVALFTRNLKWKAIPHLNLKN
ncbi:MAG: glycosyltransferase family 2 protein [Bacilli bacterium]|nr:glycosyltransferase family 2 protein [Bacilli bacterium]